MESSDVDYQAKTVTVKCGEHCDVDAMIAAIERAGFGATLADESRRDDRYERDESGRDETHARTGEPSGARQPQER